VTSIGLLFTPERCSLLIKSRYTF